MSDIVLTSSRAGAAPTITDAKTLKALLPGPPTAQRTFTLEDTIAVFAEVYDNRADDTAHRRSQRDGAAPTTGRRSSSPKRSATARRLAPRAAASATSSAIPMQDLVPGRFVLDR